MLRSSSWLILLSLGMGGSAHADIVVAQTDDAHLSIGGLAQLTGIAEYVDGDYKDFGFYTELALSGEAAVNATTGVSLDLSAIPHFSLPKFMLAPALEADAQSLQSRPQVRSRVAPLKACMRGSRAMKLAIINARAVILEDNGYVDIAEASEDQFNTANLYERWSDFRAWAASTQPPRKPLPSQPKYGAPSPHPRQSFAVGVNYADHAKEASMALPSDPMVFTKFPSCIVGEAVPLVADIEKLDWEVELVVIMGKSARKITREQAWSHVAGLSVGQDISDRALQFNMANAQFCLSKSREGYGPIGPWLVTLDEFANPDDLAISCSINGEIMQQSRTKHLIHDVPAIISYLSQLLTLLPGDVIFTGTPAGIGLTRTPPRFLRAGETLVSSIEGIGELRTQVVAA